VERRTHAVVAACQVAPVLGDVEGNLARVTGAVRAAAAQGADVIVLPELATTGYAFHHADELRPHAEPADGPTLRSVAAVAAELDVVVVSGFAERDESGRLFNSAFIVDASGVRAVYRKAHLWDNEVNIFVPGDGLPPVVDTRVGRVGVIVCYDIEFPEWTRTAALRGADLLCVPTNWPATSTPPGERPEEIVHAQAAALANRMFVAVCDRVGRERDVDWAGGSAIIAPNGYPLALAEPGGAEQTLIARCDLTLARAKTSSTHNDAWLDRRPALYGLLTAEAPLRAGS
jgi:predicted amidohydrolase